jgi:hypothetical protein
MELFKMTLETGFEMTSGAKSKADKRSWRAERGISYAQSVAACTWFRMTGKAGLEMS